MLEQVTKVSESLKAIMGMIVGIVGAVVTSATTEGTALPDIQPFDTKGWLIFVGIAALGYFGVYLPPNKLNTKQVDGGLAKLTDEQRAWVLSRWNEAE